MTPPRSRANLHYVLAGIWLLYTVSLAAWWLNVGLTVTDRRAMFLMEGATFIVVLVAGGIALMVGIRREHRRRESLEMFFMSFTHDMKTSLARVQLQAEGLREDWPDGPARADVDRLLQDMLRLQIQLENSLFVAQPDGRLLRERVDVQPALERLSQDWPDVVVEINGDGAVAADARAFDAVFRNLFQNATLHGGATKINVQVDRATAGIRLTLEDNGEGVPTDSLRRLGEAFVRPGVTSGTGVGLYVCRQLVTRMRGTMSFGSATGPNHGLRVAIQLPEAR